MFELVFTISISVYFIQSALFIIGSRFRFKIRDEGLPKASILVAARNEAANILDCLKSLNELEYPDNMLEIIIINDKSTDDTGKIIDDFIADKPKFRCIIPGEEIGNLKGKTNALANALKSASGEIILTTDADCTVSRTWAKRLASYYSPDVAIVCGYTTQSYSNLFEGMQEVDFIYLLAVAAGSMNLKKPLSCIGNNMSYRLSVYREIGGYESLPFSVTEDFNLLMSVFNLKKYKIIYPLDNGALVTSKPCPDLKSLYWQKKRWGVGGLGSDYIGFLVMAAGFAANLCMLLTPLFFSRVVLLLFLFKIFTDFFLVAPVYKRLNLNLNFRNFLAFQVYYIIYVLALPFVVLPSRKIRWKGREF